MKKLIGIMAISASMNAFAKWEVNDNGVAMVVGFDTNEKPWIAAYDIKNKKTVSFVSFDKCFNDDVSTSNQKIEGTKVKFTKSCLNNRETYTPTSEAGQEFVMKQFREKLQIIFRNVIFKGHGFTKAVNEQIAFHKDDAL